MDRIITDYVLTCDFKIAILKTVLTDPFLTVIQKFTETAKTFFKEMKTDAIITGTFVNFQRERNIF